MKILLLSFYYQPDLCAGSFRNTALVEALKRKYGQDMEVDVLTTMPNRYDTFKQTGEAVESDGIINVWRIQLPRHKSGFVDQIWSFRAYQRGVMNILAKNNTSYDLVVASSSRLFTAYLGARVANSRKLPLYLDIRDIFTDTIEDVVKNKLVLYTVLPVLKAIEKYTIKSATHLNIVSGGFEDYFRKYYSGSVTKFTNGIDLKFLDFDYIRKPQGYDERQIVTYAGNIGEGQGLEKIIPQIAALTKDRFVFRIIGDGGTKTKLVKVIQDLGVSNVELVNPVNRDELNEHYKSSDFLFLHLNDYEAFHKVLPSKIFEYAATNKPMIAGVSGFARKFLENEVNNVILFDPCDAADLNKKLSDYTPVSPDRSGFIAKFQRDNIMDEMAESLVGVASTKSVTFVDAV
ncbi:MAG: glycosyltransferase family 4 protein [Candidatus Babeliales bacterium]